jgi:octaprenyl-diphosphate synthase
MIEGELDEYALGGDLRITEGQYLNIVENKTAVLFAACCRIGAILGLASPEEEEAVAGFGLNLGKTFQIVDDILDFTGDAGTLGKPVLTDLAEGRVTLPLIRALKAGGRPLRDRVKSLVGRKDIRAGERGELLESLAASGSFDYAAQKAREFAERSLESLDRFPDSTPRETLVRLAVFVLTRNR